MATHENVRRCVYVIIVLVILVAFTRRVSWRPDMEGYGEGHLEKTDGLLFSYPVRPRPIDSNSISDTGHRSESEDDLKDWVVTDAPPLATFYPSKDLFVRAVYFDARPRDGHRNASVFLLVCLKNITDNKLIIGCQVDDKPAVHFDVKLIAETPLFRAFYPNINHEEVLVYCHDLPARNGSTGYIMYRTTPNSDSVIAASERPLLFPPPRIEPTSHDGRKYSMTIVTCAKIFGGPPWLQEWLTYQKTLGVDHVHLDVEDSFMPKENLKHFLDELIKEGYLSVDIWKKYLSPRELWYHNQGLIYEDCPYRFRGTYDYIVMLDTDDFLIPRVTGEKHLHYYINRFCRGKGIGSCKFKWVEYFPDVYGFNKSISTDDGNITQSLKDYTHFNQGNPKSLHRTTVLIDTSTHYASIMMPGYRIVSVPVTEAYVAHVRQNNQIDRNNVISGVP